mgnify:CR=1 FL=1
MLAPASIQVDAKMKKVRKGKVMTIAQIQERLTNEQDATSEATAQRRAEDSETWQTVVCRRLLRYSLRCNVEI